MSAGRVGGAKRSPTKAPSIDPLRLPDLRDGESAELMRRKTHEATRFTGADVAGQDLSGASFTECELLELNAHETRFRGARFVETRLERLNAPILTAARVTMHDVEIDHSRLGSVEAYDSRLHSTMISNSKLGWVNLRASELRDVIFRNCTIDELDLGEASLTRVLFVGCSAKTLLVGGARLADVDLRGLDLSSVGGLDSLDGATITSEQAMSMTPLFAEHLGIRIED